MPIFEYSGVDRSGKKVKGVLEAQNEGSFRMSLRGQGIRPTQISIKGATPHLSISDTQNKKKTLAIPRESLVIFTRQMQLLISSGIPLLQGLEVISEQSINKNLTEALVTIKERVGQGSFFWESLNNYPKIFPKIYVALIRAGETSGTMDQMLKSLSRYIEDSERLKKIVKSAMVYPIVVICIGIGVIIVMLVVVIPKFEEMLKNANQELPVPTQIIIAASHFMGNHFMSIVSGIGLIGYLIFKYFGTEEGKSTRDQILFKLPLFGNLVRKSGIARFCRTMQTLLSSGINLIDAIDICKQTIDNVVIEADVSKMRAEIEQGKTLGMVITRMSVFPKMVAQMVSVGEATGNLDKMLEKVADFFESEVEGIVGGLSKLIEPLLLVFLGTTVGGMLIAMYLPIFKLAGGAGE